MTTQKNTLYGLSLVGLPTDALSRCMFCGSNTRSNRRYVCHGTAEPSGKYVAAMVTDMEYPPKIVYRLCHQLLQQFEGMYSKLGEYKTDQALPFKPLEAGFEHHTFPCDQFGSTQPCDYFFPLSCRNSWRSIRTPVRQTRHMQSTRTSTRQRKLCIKPSIRYIPLLPEWPLSRLEHRENTHVLTAYTAARFLSQVLRRGESIESIMEKSEDLSASSMKFYETSKKTRCCTIL